MANYPVQVQSFEIVGAGAVAGATTLTLSSFKDILGNNLTMTAFGDIGYGVIEPNTTNEDSVTFTGITQNSNGTATLTGVNSIAFNTPFTSSTGLRVSHAGSVTFIITNSAAFYANFANKNNIETITQNWSVPDPIGMNDIANKEYVLSVVNGGSVSVASVIVGATADTTISAGQVVYLKSNGRWALADASDPTTIYNVQIGMAQGSGTSGNAITGGVLIKGVDSNQTGLVAGTTYYVRNGGGLPSSSAGTYTRVIGIGDTATSLYCDPVGTAIVSGQVSTTSTVSVIPKTGTGGYLSESFIQNIVTAGTDQSQTTSNTTITAGESDSTTGKHYLVAEKFIPTAPAIQGVSLWKIADSGTFTGTVKISLQADVSGSPSGTDLASYTISNAVWLKLPAAAEFTIAFSSQYESMVVDNPYWIVVTPSTNDSTNHINLGANSSGGYANGALKFFNLVDGWSSISTTILYFKTNEGTLSKLVQTGSSSGLPPLIVRPYSFVALDKTSGSATGNSTTVLYSKLLPAGFFSANSGLSIQLFGTVALESTGSGSATATLSLKLNGTQINSVAVSGSSSTSTSVSRRIYMLGANSLSSQTINYVDFSAAPASINASSDSPTSIDLTAPVLLEVVGTTTNTGGSITGTATYSGIVIEKIASTS